MNIQQILENHEVANCKNESIPVNLIFAIREIIKETLQLAANEADTNYDSANNVIVDKQSILDVIKQIEI